MAAIVDINSVFHHNTPPLVLGESPIYRHADHTLHYIDMLAHPCTLHILPLSPETGAPSGEARVVVLSAPVKTIRFIRGVIGRYIVATSTGIGYLSELTGHVTLVKTFIDGEDWFMNDGSIDPRGRFWVGEVDMVALGSKWKYGGGGAGGEEDLDPDPRGRLWRCEVGDSGEMECVVMERGVVCGNGIGWSPDGRFMYFNDSVGVVWRYDFDGEKGEISNRVPLVKVQEKGVLNDGMVVDEEGNLWIAMWLDSCVKVHSPDGKLIKKITFPSKCVTCPAWGGKNNDILFVASAQPESVGVKSELGDQGGHLFRYDAGVTGMINHEFAAEKSRLSTNL